MSKPPIGKTDIGTNGISSYWAGDKYFYFTNSHGLEVRIGNYGIKVDSTGLKKFTTSGWQNI